MSRLNETLTLIRLLLLTLAMSSTPIRLVQTPTHSSVNNSEPTNFSTLETAPDAVPEWFENCVHHWVFRVRIFDALVDRQPFTTFRGHSTDERVLRCWANETMALAHPNTTELGGISPSDASPLVLGALKNLVAKGLAKPFSRFETRSRVNGVRTTVEPPFDYWSIRRMSNARKDFGSFKRSIEGGCTDSIRECDDDNYTSCDQHSLEYWCHFFRVYDFPWNSTTFLSQPIGSINW